MKRSLIILSTVVGVVIAVQSGSAAVNIRAEFDKTFAFKNVRTVGWAPKPGAVMVARTPDDDPEDLQRRAEPMIIDAVNAELPKRGLTFTTDAPDLTLTYFLLLTIGDSSQTLGQFLPPVTEWAIPPFSPSTTALKVFRAGSLVFDLSSKGKPVWRGIGEAQIKKSMDDAQRAILIREVARVILRRYPPRK